MINIKGNYLYNLTALIYHEIFYFFVSWFDFFLSLKKYNSKKILIYHNSIYHFKTFERKKFNFYIKLLSKKFFVIKINLNSKLMRIILRFFFKSNKIDQKMKNLSNKKIDLNFIKQRIIWDKFNKSSYKNLNYLLYIKSRKDYLNFYKNFLKSKKELINQFYSDTIFRHSHIAGFLTNEMCWDDWIFSNYALKNRKFVIFPESPQLGFTYYNNNTELKNSKLFNTISKKNYTQKQLNYSKKLLSKSLSLKTRTSPFYYMKDFKRKKKNYLPYKHDYSFIYFSNVFVDGPNYGVQDKSFSEFIDYFDNFLFILEHCEKYKIPLYIKLHPLSLKYREREKYSHEFYFHNCLLNIINKKKYKSNSFIEILDGSLPNNYFKFLKKPIALTPRSNVSIEMGYLGIPCFTFFDNYWKNFNFVKKTNRLPKSKKDIDRIYHNYNSQHSKKDALKVFSFLIEQNKKNIFLKKNFDGEIASINKKNINEINSIVNKLHF